MQTKNGLFSDIEEKNWNDWHWQVANRAKNIADLEAYGIRLTEDEKKGLEATLGRLRMAVTPYYLSLIDLNDTYDCHSAPKQTKRRAIAKKALHIKKSRTV